MGFNKMTYAKDGDSSGNDARFGAGTGANI